MNVETVYEVKDSNGQISRYSDIKHMRTLRLSIWSKYYSESNGFVFGKYHIAREMQEPHDRVILNEEGDIIWKGAPSNTETYIEIEFEQFIFFGNKRGKINCFGLCSGGEIIQLRNYTDYTNIKMIDKKIIYGGICIYRNILVKVNPLSVYKGIKEIAYEKEASNVKVSLKNIDGMNVIAIYFETSDKSEHALFFNNQGEELEFKLVPKKQG